MRSFFVNAFRLFLALQQFVEFLLFVLFVQKQNVFFYKIFFNYLLHFFSTYVIIYANNNILGGIHFNGNDY